MSHRIHVLASAAVLAVSAAVTTAPAHAGPATTYERETVATANGVRVDHGLRAMRRADCLARFANAHARRLANRRTLRHQDLRPVMRECRLSRAAENIAMGYRSGSAVVRLGWMQSPGHRDNLLARGHRLTAVGASRDSLGLWWTVQLFGRR